MASIWHPFTYFCNSDNLIFSRKIAHYYTPVTEIDVAVAGWWRASLNKSVGKPGKRENLRNPQSCELPSDRDVPLLINTETVPSWTFCFSVTQAGTNTYTTEQLGCSKPLTIQLKLWVAIWTRYNFNLFIIYLFKLSNTTNVWLFYYYYRTKSTVWTYKEQTA